MLRGHLIPASYVHIRSGSITSKQYRKMDLVTLVLTVLLLRYYVILLTTDEQYHRLLGYLFAKMAVQGRVLIFTLTFFLLVTIGAKIVTRRHVKNKTLDHLFDMIPLTEGGQDINISRQMKLTLSNLQALKVRVKMTNIAVSLAAVYFPLAIAIMFGIGFYTSISHEAYALYMVNYGFWYMAWVYLTYIMTYNVVVCFFCWYLGTQLIKFRFRQVNQTLIAIRDEKLDIALLDTLLTEQKHIIAKVHRYNLAIEAYIFLLIYICSPLLGSVIFLTVYVEFKMKLIKVGLIMITGLAVASLWFISSRTADVNVEVSILRLIFPKRRDLLVRSCLHCTNYRISSKQAKKSAPILYSIMASKQSKLSLELMMKMAAVLESVTSKSSPVAFSCGDLYPWIPMSFYDVRYSNFIKD
ncbi:hypothetical protein HDE_04265 [Halotydeus destructor]|nr:hypothetical protein HDE_04265 [Halotydeus destructor]